MAKGIHTEETFEIAIEQYLLQESSGYVKGDASNYDAAIALDPTTLFKFIKDTQLKKWERIKKIHGVDVEKKLLFRLNKELELRGMLDVIRKGFTDYGVKFDCCYFRPETSLNPDAQAQYESNIFTVTRQVYYSTKHRNSLDMLLSINGLPVVSIELKNQFTGQTVENAKKQFKYDRDHKELLFAFKKRALVHFAVDTHEAYMTTRLNGTKTFYLPFNQGHNNGKGNPPDKKGGYRTAYLWEKVWQKPNLLEIISKFMHVETEEIKIGDSKKKKETMFFPRYHQLDVVKELVSEVKTNGAGENYLIQHSAGSGKSKSIAWLAYQLFSLHNEKDERVYNAVIVITDRRVLDQQLQNTIYQIEHKQGVVQKIDESSTQLAEQLTTGGSIIITTLQKFPFVLDKIGEIPNRNYAVIIDEAHSSQGGQATTKMKEVLAGASIEETIQAESENEDDSSLDAIRKSMLARGKQDNLSFFAFTATPKAKTLEVFGVKGTDSKPRPYHLYSMRQAIEEGFILDVLKNYTTYKTYYKLSKAIEDDPEVNKKKAARAIGRFLSLHPHNLAQKTEVMVEHFRQVVAKKIGGKAKAMVVSSSRLHTVRYKREFDRYIKEKGYDKGDKGIKTLVAFSGKVIDEGVEFTEPQMNGFGMKELPKKFATDDYQVLLVADKYQTGFDQPLLHTMYVDKKLSGVKAVQTLSRLNRTTSGKEDTFVLDFANDRETILESFQPYYEVTTIDQATDPNHLYDLKGEIEKVQVIWQSEIDTFIGIYSKNVTTFSVGDQKKLYGALDPAVERFKALTDEEQDDFKNAVTSYIRLYSFLSQIMPFHDIDLEKLFITLKYLNKVLPKTDLSERFQLNDEVALEYYRLQQIEDGSINLAKGTEGELSGITEAGIRKPKDEFALISEIINVLNDKLGTDFTSADQLFFDMIEEEMVLDETLVKQAQSNTKENFKFGFDDKFMDVVIERMEQNEELFAKLMDDEKMAKIVKQMLLDRVYKRLSKQAM